MKRFSIRQSIKKIKYILDLGASPGGWSQLVSKRFHNSRIYAIDILEMEPLENVNFFQENIENIDSIENIYDLKGKFNLVISDIAPNITGIVLLILKIFTTLIN